MEAEIRRDTAWKTEEQRRKGKTGYVERKENQVERGRWENESEMAEEKKQKGGMEGGRNVGEEERLINR